MNNNYLTDVEKENIYRLHFTSGYSGRKIAYITGRSKSAVNNYIKSMTTTPVDKPKGPRILILDLETAPAIALTFGRFDIRLSQDNIVKEGGYILCAAWKWLGESEVGYVYLNQQDAQDGNDILICDKLWELYEEADAIVAHNGKSFDQKMLQTRVVGNGLAPLPKVKVLDTKLLAKKYLRLPSNALDSIGEYFGLGRKIDTGGISLWKRVIAGEEQAMKEMVDYNIQDVELLEKVYLRLRHLGTAGENLNAGLFFDDNEVHCSICGSTDVAETGRTVQAASGIYKEIRCNSCGAVHRDKTNTTTKSQRQAQLVV